jgi:hypothetical protein
MTDPEIRFGIERAAEGARAAGTPFISFITPEEIPETRRNSLSPGPDRTSKFLKIFASFSKNFEVF